MPMYFDGTNYSFISRYGNVVDENTRKKMDMDEDGKISKEEKDLYYNEYYKTRRAELANFKSNNPNSELGFEFNKLDFNQDGFLDEKEQGVMDELLKMNEIANKFIKENEEYKIGNLGGVVSEVKTIFDEFSSNVDLSIVNLNDTNEKVPFAEIFETKLNENITGDNLSMYKVDKLINSSELVAKLRLKLVDIVRAESDGVVSDEESVALEDKVSDSLMVKALKNYSAEDILSNLLEGVSDTNVKIQILENAEKMVDLVNIRYTLGAEDFLKQLTEMADNISELVSGKGIVKAYGKKNSSTNAQQVIEQNTLPYRKIYFSSSYARIDKNVVYKALMKNDDRCLDQFASFLVEYFTKQGISLDVSVVGAVLREMPKNFYFDRRLDSNFINAFNETLKIYAGNNSSSIVDNNDIEFAYDKNLEIKANITEEDTSLFYTQKTTQAAAKATISAIKPQIENVAENAYIIKHLDFNQELFDNCFNEILDVVVSQFDNGKNFTMNEVLNAFITQFNGKWASASLVDIAEKQQ